MKKENALSQFEDVRNQVFQEQVGVSNIVETELESGSISHPEEDETSDANSAIAIADRVVAGVDESVAAPADDGECNYVDLTDPDVQLEVYENEHPEGW